MKSFSVQVVETAALALLLCSLAAGQVSQCAATGSPKLRFVAQLNVNGCALFVHDTGASDGPHLAVEPVMCVTDSLKNLSPEIIYESPTIELYVSIPVLLRDAGMLATAQRQLQHLSPRSVSFLTISSIQASMETTFGTVNVKRFIWSPNKSKGVIRFQSTRAEDTGEFASKIRSDPSVILNNLMLTVNYTCHQLSYRPMLQNQTFFDLKEVRQKYSLPACRQLRFIRSINLGNCTARVHQRLDIIGHFLIEPLLCHNISSWGSESVMYDNSSSMYYLKLDLVLEDEATLEAVRSQLANLSTRSVTFMKLWSAQSIVSSALSSRFLIGPLRVSADWKTAQLQLFCRFAKQCHVLRPTMSFEPLNLSCLIGWQVTSMTSQLCLAKADEPRTRRTGEVCDRAGLNCGMNPRSVLLKGSSKFLSLNQAGQYFIKIQQRYTGNVSFQRTWVEYEAGFGDETDFWIGLSAIHSLSAGGTTLRVEMELWNGTELHAEYAGFQVGNASTKYEMTYREMLRKRSNVEFDAMEKSKGARFSTFDNDNDKASALEPEIEGLFIDGSCSNIWGKGGWWFNECHHFYPNGLYPSGQTTRASYMIWNSGSGALSLRSVRLLLEL